MTKDKIRDRLFNNLMVTGDADLLVVILSITFLKVATIKVKL